MAPSARPARGRNATNRRNTSAWLVAWLGGAAIGVLNGVLRENTYAPRVGEERAHRISSATAIVALAGWFAFLQRRRPLQTRAQATAVGAAWVAMTIAFEFGFGRLVAKQSWRELTADYDLRRGRMWPLVLTWVGLGPAVTRAVAGRSVR
jgi:hypothetical protein